MLGLKAKEECKAIINSNWPGGLTAVIQKPSSGELANFSFPTIGVRAPNHKELLKLLNILPVKLLTTSANRSGAPSDTNPGSEVFRKNEAQPQGQALERGFHCSHHSAGGRGHDAVPRR